MKSFEVWLSSTGSRTVPSSADEAWLKERWDTYIESEWKNVRGRLDVQTEDADAVFQKYWRQTPGLPRTNFDPKRVKTAIWALQKLTADWIRKFKTENEPTSDDGTLCIYHSFAHVRGADADNALALCQTWKASRIVADLPYDDDRCVKAMAVKYGFDKWCPLKGSEIIQIYKTPGMELIISVYGEVSTMPIKYWTDGSWHKKLHDIHGSVELDGIMKTAGTTGHAIYGKVADRGDAEFWDNENNGGKKTTQVSSAAKERRCVVFSRPPQ